MGAGARGFWLDYGFLLSGNQGGQHRVALSLRPGSMGLAGGDPFGQRNMPRDFDEARVVGPPVPKDLDRRRP